MSYNSTDELENVIQRLKIKQALEFNLLRKRVLITSERLRPINILKKTLLDIVSNKSMKCIIIDAALLVGTNYLTEKLAPKKPVNKLTSILVSFLEFSLMMFAEKK